MLSLQWEPARCFRWVMPRHILPTAPTVPPRRSAVWSSSHCPSV